MVALAVLVPLSFPEKLGWRHWQMLSSGQGQYVDTAYLEVLHQWLRTPNLYNTLILWAQHSYGWKNVKGLSRSALYFSSPVSMKSLFCCVLLKQTVPHLKQRAALLLYFYLKPCWYQHCDDLRHEHMSLIPAFWLVMPACPTRWTMLWFGFNNVLHTLCPKPESWGVKNNDAQRPFHLIPCLFLINIITTGVSVIISVP